MLTREDTARNTSSEQIRPAKAVEPRTLFLSKLLFNCDLQSHYLGVQIDLRAVELLQ
jgi:hypothetical protein